tara:strand:+ start:106 stop:258 length:153 start_codon:yes stop_codon:yes gene_type:complete
MYYKQWVASSTLALLVKATLNFQEIKNKHFSINDFYFVKYCSTNIRTIYT